MEGLTLDALTQVAGYFAALSEPTRLQILSLLRDKERNVGELAELCGYTSANISRHLAILSKHGLVAKENRGTSVFYRIADESIYTLCDVVCGSLLKQLEDKARSQKEFAQTARLAKER
ncbi:ArsR/SmtB family transcription factor [Undibacterium sp. MH2W]|uniref:ArsR/SmtB family transcription factor n=1 Tax=Undibacterium sp. MH2W TaxID=3413044 RepID=UPI003BF1C46B